MSFRLIMSFGMLMLLFVSCTKDSIQNLENDTAEVELSYVTSVYSPLAGKVNETIDVGIYLRGMNRCYVIESFIEETIGNTTTIGVKTLTYTDCFTFLDAPFIMDNYSFKAPTPGVYYLKFISSPTTVIMDSLIITE